MKLDQERHTLIRAGVERISPAIKSLFQADMPAGLRCLSVLDGHVLGDVFTDNVEHPTWAVVREAAFGTLYPGGAVTKQILTVLVNRFRPAGWVLIGLWPEDPFDECLPDAPDYDGLVIDFFNRPVGQGLDHFLRKIPEGCEVRRLDRDLFEHFEGAEDCLKAWGSMEAALEKETITCLMRGETIVSSASAGYPVNGISEIGTRTHPAYRRRGYATFTCAYTIRACEQAGYQTYWNTNKENAASVALARKLGYHLEREYRLLGWITPEPA